jgi:hypothetical protein
MNNPKTVMLTQIDIPRHKLEYVLHTKVLVDGLWSCLKAYGIEHTKENHDLLLELVQTKLEGPDLEREWTEEEYENFVVFNPKEI